jgi:hypothetical protein
MGDFESTGLELTLFGINGRSQGKNKKTIMKYR